MKEIWKQIKGFEGLYDISNKGRVRSWINKAGNKMKDPYIRKMRKNYGYVYCNLKKGDKYYAKRVHRLIAIEFIPNPQNKPCVNHKNGIKDDNRIENLEWVTHRENDIHAFKTGLRESVKGEDNGHSKITEKDVIEIRDLCSNSSLTQREIGIKFGISQPVVSEIHNRRYWSHV